MKAPARRARDAHSSGGRVRPTSSRVRDALFNSLAGRLTGVSVLDLFAGTGGLGLGALERGAARVVFIERNRRLGEAIRAELRRRGLEDRGEVWVAEVRPALARLATAGQRFGLVLLDPPYGRGLLQRTLDDLAPGVVLDPGGLIVAEGHWRDAPHTPAGLVCLKEARYGETALWTFAPAAQREGEAAEREGER